MLGRSFAPTFRVVVAFLFPLYFTSVFADEHGTRVLVLQLIADEADRDAQAKPERVRLVLNSQHVRPDKAPRTRVTEPAARQLLVVGLDRGGNELTRSVITDPRATVSDSLRTDGTVVGTRTYADSVLFTVLLPQHGAMERIRIFEPRPGTNAMQTALLAELAIPALQP